MDFSVWQIAIVLLIALIVFGPERLPELGQSLGAGMREFKDSISGTREDGSAERAALEAEFAVTPHPQPATEPVEGTTGREAWR